MYRSLSKPLSRPLPGTYDAAMNDGPSPLARALGRVPCGLYIVSTRSGAQPLGFLGSFVAQVGLDPPTVCVAVGKGRDHLAAMRASGRFALSIVDEASKGVMGAFFKKLPEGQTPFDGLATQETQAGSLVLSEALAWLDCELSGEHESGDHVVVFGRVVEGDVTREGEPKIHLRKDGLSY